MKIKNVFVGRLRYHIIILLLTFYTFGLINIVYGLLSAYAPGLSKSKKFLVLFVVLLATGMAIGSTGSSDTNVQSVPVEDNTPVESVNSDVICPICGEEGTYEPDFSEGYGEISYSCDNGHDLIYFVPTDNVYFYLDEYLDDYAFDSDEVHFY